MKIISPNVEILTPLDGQAVLQHIERCGRVCYKSEDKITDTSAAAFVAGIIKRGHEAVLEHFNITVKFICDRGVSHEIVRHRLASYCQESTRYVASSKRDCAVNSEDDVLYSYNEAGLSMKRIADRSNDKYSEYDVSEILRKHNATIREHGRRGTVNSHYFETIDTPEKAFLLGFIMADGSIRRDSYQLTISQKESESWWLLNMIREFIQPDAKSLTISDFQISTDLRLKGIIPNKTYESTSDTVDLLWNSVPAEYKPDFLRGLLDGDGSIRWFYQKPTSKTQSCHIQFTGNRYLMERIRDFLSAELDYTTTVKTDYYSGVLHRVVITDSGKGKQLCDMMYRNFKFPYGHSKTARYYEAFDLPIPIAFQRPLVGDFNVIAPSTLSGKSLWHWGQAMVESELAYKALIESGCSPQEARAVLPNSLKTEVVMTANLREWRHFFNLRTAPAAHPQMREVAKMLLWQMREMVPVVFDDCSSVVPSTVVNQYGANNTNITNAGNITINL